MGIIQFLKGLKKKTKSGGRKNLALPAWLLELGHQSSDLGTPGSSDPAWNLHHWLPWFSGLQTWTELCHWLFCSSSLQMVDWGAPLPHNLNRSLILYALSPIGSVSLENPEWYIRIKFPPKKSAPEGKFLRHGRSLPHTPEGGNPSHRNTPKKTHLKWIDTCSS